MLVGYIPNELDLGDPFGISDYEGLETLFLAANESATTSQDQQRLLKRRLIMDSSLASGNDFQDGEVVFVDNKHTLDGSSPLIESVGGQFDANAHITWQNSLLDLALTAAGISPATLGRADGGNLSGVALKLRMTLTRSVIDSKQEVWAAALAEAMGLAARLDSMTIGTGDAIKPAMAWADPMGAFSIELGDSLPTDEEEVANTVTKARAAGVMSRRESIRRLNPGFTQEQLDEEEAQLDSEAATQSLQVTEAAKAAVSSLPQLQLPPLNG